MKDKIAKIITIITLLITLTMANFIFVGANIYSYAVSNVKTNHSNVDFEVYFKEGEQKTTAIQNKINESATLFMQIKVSKEGYFNGKITLDESNFTLKQTENPYINKIEGNTINLNQISAGQTAIIEMEVEPVKEERYNTGLLDMMSKISLSGIYRDSTQKDIKIEAQRELNLKIIQSNNEENVINEAKVITNKIMKIEGQEKRLLQLEIKQGLKENSYPIKGINAKVEIPIIEENEPEVEITTNLNNMTSCDYKYENGILKVQLKNEPDENNTISWNSNSEEEIILTLIYDKDVNCDNTQIKVEEELNLYDESKITTNSEINITNEEIDNVLEVLQSNKEESIYKGKLYSSISRDYETTTVAKINFAKVINSITIKETQDTFENVEYKQTTVSKEQFDKILGKNGLITIKNENGEEIAKIYSSSQVNENGEITVNYQANAIEITTTAPQEEGELELKNTKTIKEQNQEIIKNATELTNKVNYKYNEKEEKEVQSTIKLEESSTKVRLETNKESLSTIIGNNVEIRAILSSNNEQYNLFKNPILTFELPEEVEEININNIDLIYETELKVKNYYTDGRNIIVEFEGEQTNYKDTGIEGAVIIINTTINVNKKTPTKDSTITLNCENRENNAQETKAIKIIAPKDLTAVHSIKELGIETLGQEETKVIDLKRGSEAKQLETEIEIINNNENAIEDVKIIGTFPTNNEKNNINIKLVNGININAIEGAKVYYSENEKATDDIENSENQWEEEITDTSKVKKYLIIVPNMDTRQSSIATYTVEVPEALEYNQSAMQGYKATYTNTVTKTQNQITATTLEMETGVGPQLETKLTSTIGGQEIKNDTKVKNGEVIKYKIEVSNTGSEDVTDIKVQGNVPEGTTLVEPEDGYEYTGATYYRELSETTYETTVESLKVGEVATKTYEVRVNSDTREGTNIINKSQITYGDVTKTSDESQIITEKGDLRLTVKRVTDRTKKLYENSDVVYYAIIENTSNEKQKDVEISVNLPNEMTLTGLRMYENSWEDLQTNTNISIGEIEANSTKILNFYTNIGTLPKQTTELKLSATGKCNGKDYLSNIFTDYANKINVDLQIEADTQSQYVKTGDKINYTITVVNKGRENLVGLNVIDEIPDDLVVTKVSVNDEEIEELKENNNLVIPCDVNAQAEGKIVIETIVDYSATREKAEPISNSAYAEYIAEKVATTAEVTHIIEVDAEIEENNNEQSNNEQNNNTNIEENNSQNEGNVEENKNENIATGENIITGFAWFDENKDGKKQENEKPMSGIKVKLLNTKTNSLVKEKDGKDLETTTNEKGIYVLSHLQNGEYIAIFDYDTTKYSVTKYKAEGVSESYNSNVLMNELKIGEETNKLATTDIINLKNANISNINIGLVELQNFDLKLEKYVSKVLIQNSTGTTVREYNDASIAKAELDGKLINGTTVVVEYKIRISNVGEVDGYARKIADYVPSDLKFSSELNKDWYQSGNTLYTTSIANEKIPAGASRELKLVLTKTMTEDNTGLINNTAEIAESYNELGLNDSNSTPGNKKAGENDYSSAELILSLRTGGIVWITIGTIIALAIGIITYVIICKKTKNGKEI